MTVQKKTSKKKRSQPVMLPGFEPVYEPLPLEKVIVIKEDRGTSAPTSLGSLLKKYQPKQKNKYVSREFQDYGYRLAMELGDQTHVSLYIRLAKTIDRGLLETARSFVIDSQAKSKGRLFMWKLKQLKDETKEKKSI